jgi:hypothetical protein
MSEFFSASTNQLSLASIWRWILFTWKTFTHSPFHKQPETGNQLSWPDLKRNLYLSLRISTIDSSSPEGMCCPLDLVAQRLADIYVRAQASHRQITSAYLIDTLRWDSPTYQHVSAPIAHRPQYTFAQAAKMRLHMMEEPTIPFIAVLSAR